MCHHLHAMDWEEIEARIADAEVAESPTKDRGDPEESEPIAPTADD